MAQIRITVDKTGNVKQEGIGFVGTECNTKMAPYEALFAGSGNNVRTDKPEIHMVEQEEAKLHLG